MSNFINEIFDLLRCEGATLDNYLTTFGPFMMRCLRRLETSGTNYPLTRCHIAEYRRPQLHAEKAGKLATA
jgi:hypothetical protein